MAQILKQYRYNRLDKVMRKIYLQKNVMMSTEASGSDGITVPTLLIDNDERITLIGLNRPNNRNSLDQETTRRLSEAITKFETDETSPVAVIYGVGGSFCAGQDITELEKRCKDNDFNVEYSAFCKNNFLCRHSKKPIICGINGYCVADGLELAMYCDLRVMEDTAILGFFGRSVGLNSKCGGTARLPALIGYSRALDLLLTGRRVGGQEALKIGLVNRLVATGTALGQAVNLALSIAKFPIEALQRDRCNLYTNCFERRNGLGAAISHEDTYINANILNEIQECVSRFKSSKSEASITDSWQVKPKTIPDWEEKEILHEQRFSFNMDAVEKKSEKKL